MGEQEDRMEESSKNQKIVYKKEEDYYLVIEDNTIYEIDRRCAEHRFRNKTDADSYCYAKEIHL